MKEIQEKVSIPHLNLKGTVKNVSVNSSVIEFSNYARTFLDTTQITINNENLELEENQKVFIKFNDITIDGKTLNYSYIEIYKHIEKKTGKK